MSLAWPDKDPNEVLDYQLDWSARLEDSDTIASSTWTIPPGITADSQSFSPALAVVWLSGGSAGSSYSLMNRITTAGGRTMDQTVVISVVEK